MKYSVLVPLSSPHMMPRILYLATDFFLKGGIQRYSRFQIQAIRSHSDDDCVKALSLWPEREGSFEEELKVDYSGQGISILSKIRFALVALWYVLSWKPDIIWINHIHFLPIINILRLLQIRTPVIANVYGLELWSGRERGINAHLQHVNKVISDCHYSSRYVQENFDIEPEKVEVIWDCVDIKRFYPKQRSDYLLEKFALPSGDEYKYLLTLGRLSSSATHKGYDRFIDAIREIQIEGKVIGIIAGSGDDMKRLETRVAEEGLLEQIFFLGEIHEKEMEDVYNLCDIFSLVSERGFGKGEGIPLTPLEAAACGKPIIVGNQDGSQEAVINGVTGWIVSPDDLSQYTEVVQRTLDDKQLQSMMGDRSRRHIEENFSYGIFERKTLTVIEELASSAR